MRPGAVVVALIRSVSLLLVLSLLSLWLMPSTAWAQAATPAPGPERGPAETATPTPAPQVPVLDTGPLGEAIGQTVATALWGQFERYAQQSGPGMLLRGLLWSLGQVVKVLVQASGDGGVGSSHLLTSLPPLATYEAPLVQQAWGLVRGAALAAWGVVASAVVCWLILRMMLGYVVADELGLLPLLIGALWAINVSGDAGRFLIDLANALAGGLRLGASSLPAYDSLTGYEQDVALAVTAIAYLPLVWCFFAGRLLTLGLVDLLYVLSPLALVLGVLPFTRTWFSWWAGLLVGACVVQVPQTLALSLGTGLVALASRIANPTAAVEVWIGFAMLLLAIKLPGMLPGGFGGRGGFIGLGIGKQVAKHLTAFATGPMGTLSAGGSRATRMLATVGTSSGQPGAALVPRAGGPGGVASISPVAPVTVRGPRLAAPVPLLPAPRDE